MSRFLVGLNIGLRICLRMRLSCGIWLRRIPYRADLRMSVARASMLRLGRTSVSRWRWVARDDWVALSTFRWWRTAV